MHNEGQAGLTFWAPNINVFRDPRWGRGQETPGEDPMVVSAYAVEYVRGFQGLDWRNGGNKDHNHEDGGGKSGGLKLSACCKHFTAYDLEKWGQFTRYNFNAIVTKQDLEETYQPPFRSCIEQGKSTCLMCSYNSVNGIPTCADKDLLTKARKDWGFRGYIASDCDAVATIFEYHNYTKNEDDAVSIALKAGTDINCGNYMVRHMGSAVKQGKVSEKDIDRALFNLFTVQLWLGLFDGDPAKNHYGNLGSNNVCTSEHTKLAYEAARQGMVLLKNSQKFLPLKQNDVTSLAVIGPLANISHIGGDYIGVPCYPKSIFEELQNYVKETSYAPGCIDVGCNSTAFHAQALSVAKEAEYVIVVAGLDLSQETEDLDRYSLLLPGHQTSLIQSLAAVSKKPLILVLTGGGPVDVSFAETDPRIASIIWIGYPGETGAKALSEIIFGKYNPGGRLPMTWYPESFTKIPMSNMTMRADPSTGYPGRTYKFYTGGRLYGYGHGLSYTDFSYKITSAPVMLSLSRPLTNVLTWKQNGLGYIPVQDLAFCDSLKFATQVSVTNNGDLDGDTVVLLYSRAPSNFKDAPLKQVIGFNRIHVSRHKSVETSILVDPCKDLSIVNEMGVRALPLGEHTLMVEDSQHILSVEILSRKE